MSIQIKTIGGYNEVGKNCTAVNIDGKSFLFDLGLQMENYIQFQENDKPISAHPDDLMRVKAVPDIEQLGDWKNSMQAIMPTHAHLDHIGAIPFLGNKLKAPIISTPYTTEVINTILNDDGIRLRNQIRSAQVNSTVKLTDDIKAEFIHVTHSTPHSSLIALHTPKGIILYANDFKFDMHPTLGKKPNFKRLEEIGNEGVEALIVDSTYASTPGRTPSEAVAKQMLEDVLLQRSPKGGAMIVTTFSSHIARLKSIVECAQKLGRRPVFLGRSLHKYVMAAERCGIHKFSGDVSMAKFPKQMKKELKQISQKKDKYLIVATGHQGEPQSTLSKMANDELKFPFSSDDWVVFSCKTIPTPTNKANRERLESQLKSRHARLFLNVHVSGHASAEDLREMVQLVKPKHIVPSHGDKYMRDAMAKLSEEMGYIRGETVHMMKDSDTLRI